MRKINTGRALLGGVVAALIIDIIEGVVNGVVLRGDWTAAMQSLGKSGEISGGGIALYNLGGLLYGLIGVWLYAALISRYGKGSITAAKAGLVVWSLTSALPMVMWTPSGILPGNLMAYSVLVDFIAILLGVTMGAILYREDEAPRAATVHA
ncbi:MAG TPA: hypothetical protein VGL72_22590 [Bryobacteraceae bacterium]|jgi:hypothetical protein